MSLTHAMRCFKQVEWNDNDNDNNNNNNNNNNNFIQL